MPRETAAGGNLVIIPNPDCAPTHARRITIIRKRKMVPCLQPTMICMTKGGEFPFLDHLPILSSLVDRKSVVSGKSVSVRVDLGGRRIIKKKHTLLTVCTLLNIYTDYLLQHHSIDLIH